MRMVSTTCAEKCLILEQIAAFDELHIGSAYRSFLYCSRRRLFQRWTSDPVPQLSWTIQ